MMAHPEYRDESRIAHMHTYLERVAAILPSLTESEMEDGEPRTERVLYNLTLLGEAANNVSREYAAAHPSVDFKDMAGLRHRLVHDYANIDLSVIWKILQEDFPEWRRTVTDLCMTLPPAPPMPDNLDEFR